MLGQHNDRFQATGGTYRGLESAGGISRFRPEAEARAIDAKWRMLLDSLDVQVWQDPVP